MQLPLCLPVAQRELMVASRKPLNYWVRLVPPVLGLLFLFFAAPELADRAPASAGKTVFKFGSVALFIYSILSGLYFTAETISSERREGTLPLLQLTGMRNLDLVVGKLLANAVPGIFGFCAAAPLLALSFLFGGVAAGDFMLVMLILLGTLALSLTIGIHASSHTASTGAALNQTLRGLLGVLGVGILSILYFRVRNRFVDSKQSPRTETRWLFVFGVLSVLYFALPTGSPGFLLQQTLFGVRGSLPSHVSVPIAIVLLFAMAVYFLLSAKPFTISEETSSIPSLPASPKESVLHRRSPLPKNADPLNWIFRPTDAELILGLGWAFVGGAAHLFGNSAIYNHSRVPDPVAIGLAWFAFGITAFVYFLFARRAADFVVESRRNGMFEVLLVTPLTWRELLERQRSAFASFVWLPAIILLTGEILGVLASLHFSNVAAGPETAWVFFLVTVLTYVCSLFATLWLAVLLGLRMKSASHAAFVTVLLVLVLPALAQFFLSEPHSGVIPAPYFTLIVSAWLYLAADSLIWFFCRLRLNKLSQRSPAAICDPRSK